MKRLVLCLVAALFVWGCPDPQTGKIDPYLTAHTIINQASLALPIAQGIFNQWLLAQTDAEKAKQAQLKFEQIKTAVSNGLVLAHNGVDIAKQAKEDPDVSKLLAQADEAWKSLYKFMDDLLGKGDTPIVVALGGGSQPASQPTTTSGGVGVKHAAVTVKPSPLMALPKTLIPK
jgi:hypothetical protein